MLPTKLNKVLVLAPHTDDGEFGCGGTIAKLAEQGVQVYCAAFSACEQSVLKEFPKDILITEIKNATPLLGIKPQDLLLYQYEVRKFNYSRQDILEDMVKLNRDIEPDLVFLPCKNDVHQDHSTIYQEGVRAFKFCSIFSYELPWNNFSMNTSAFVKLDEKHLEAKIKALAEYKSQMHRPYANEEFIRSLARTRGVQINTKYAEAFEVIRWIY